MRKETCTVYMLTNKANGKIYIGQTWDTFKDRMGVNGSGYKNSTYLYNAIQKYGAPNFEYTVLIECYDQKMADALEDYYIEKYNSREHDIGYNIKKGGSVGKHSEETKNKISENNPKYWEGKHLPEETKFKISQANKGNKHTEEWKENNSVFMIERHKIDGHPMQGKHHTEEARRKISEAGKGRKRSPESIEKTAKGLMMPKEREQDIIQAYLDGETARAICEKFKTSNNTIYRLLKRNNIPLKGRE